MTASVPPGSRSSGIWTSVALAGLILTITMGTRQTVGLFVHPIIHATGMGIADVSMALAIGQLMWGVFQPLFGAWADKKSPLIVLCVGALCMALGQFGTIMAHDLPTLVLMQGILAPAGSAAGSFSILIAVISARLTPDKRSVASGVINAGGSVGQFAFAPLVQFVMNLRNYQTSLAMLAGLALMSILPAWRLCRGGTTGRPELRKARPEARPAPVPETIPPLARDSLKEQLRVAGRDRSYLLLHAGFFTCGFHVAFLTTHLPGEVSLCGHAASVSAASLSIIGLCNIAGSIFAGALGKYFRMKHILAVLYASRALMIAAYLFSAKTETDFYLFAAATGFTWLATVPPTAGIVGKLFGMRYLATLFGLTLLTHQIGGFLGAWLGGLAMAHYGNYQWVWYIDVTLALVAALVNLPIREEAPTRG